MSRIPSLLIIALLLAPRPAAWASDEEYDRDPVRYTTTEAHDPFASFRRRLAEGSFDFDRQGGEQAYLRSLLAELHVSPASQVLVFSRTSLQNDRISPDHPRAIYYSDDYYVGWVPGGDAEVIAFDPQIGPVFYHVFIPRSPTEHTRVERETDCLRCHAGLTRNRMPGLLVRSVVPDAKGDPIQAAGTHFTDFRSPLRERWGGWYVTGRHGAMRHMGNVIADPSSRLDVEAGANRLALPANVEATDYLRPGSDIASLMIFEHQVTVHNAIISAHYAVLQALRRNADMAGVFKYPTNELSSTSRRLLEGHADQLVQTLLFCGEFPLEDDGIEIDQAFAADYAHGARRTPDGRSLRDLQLMTRIFKYRCSPLIYSQAFTNLPALFRSMVLERLRTVLDGELATPAEQATYAHLKEGELARIREILVATMPDLPASWSRARTAAR